MKKYLFIVLVLFVTLCLNGCMFIRSPFADINKLGTVIEPGESIIIKSLIGPVTIEYTAPTKRRLVWKGESLEFSLMKSKQLNGIYGGPVSWRKPLIGNVYGVSYGESTITFLSDKEYQEYLLYYINELGFEHRTNTQMIVRCAVEGRRKKYLYIGITKYRFAYEKRLRAED